MQTKGISLGLKVELIPFLRAFACLQTLKKKIDISRLIRWESPQDLWFKLGTTALYAPLVVSCGVIKDSVLVNIQ